ncbi:MAG: hypothetical protein ING73_01365 [Rhodocyclaceae bacterium]|nr:hypothetical protein [Rhodocyclaceae bacterium]MCA3026095.1 hypothetical protein [Rhodocyclaceae bacterium]MCA3031483.1 hypothetical protein [Rhodocyclaceae bacterium]MCA3036552.1 hypothetical protein [Rhodocyclaceae bacterium]MCA3043592.1 hypothetical protein [Rhodocyclaceae bacterium]
MLLTGIADRLDELLLSNATEHDRQIEVTVSVGTLVLLRIGDIYMDRELVCRPDYHLEAFNSVQVYPASTRLIKVGHSFDSGAFLLPLAEHPWHRLHTHSYAVMVTLADGDGLVVPCVELIRHYFGSSASLLAKLFMPPFERAALYSKAEFDETNKQLFLELAQGIRGSSASDIGRLCLDKTAWQAALRVGASVLKDPVLQGPAYPQCTFPFIGRTDLQVAGKWLSQTKGEPRTFIVYRIQSCSHRFPFVSLKYQTHDQASAAHDGKDGRGMSKQMSARDARRQSLVEQDASNSLAPKVTSFYEEVRFTDLKRKKVWRAVDLDANESEKASGDAAGSAPAVSEFALGTGTTNNRIRPIDIEALPLAKKLSEKTPPEFVLPFLAELEKLEEFEVKLLSRDQRDGWTQCLIRCHEEIGTFAPASIATFSLTSWKHRSCVVAIEEANPGEFLYRDGAIGSPVSSYMVADDMTNLQLCGKYEIAMLNCTEF